MHQIEMPRYIFRRKPFTGTLLSVVKTTDEGKKKGEERRGGKG